ncbi:MAG: DUF4249 family protein [Bacteroidota bacterium]
MYRKYILAFSFFFILFSCLDEIDLDVPAGLEDSIVIRGELVKGEPSTIVVYVSRVFNFDLTSRTPFNARSVDLMDEEGNKMNIISTQDGVHRHTFSPADPVQVEEGKKYSIRVSTFDGRTYESGFEEILPLPEKGKMRAISSGVTILNDRGQQEELPAVRFLLDTPVKMKGRAQNARLLFTPERTFKITDNLQTVCYVTGNTNINDLFVLDGTIFESDTVRDIPLSRALLSSDFFEGYYYTIYQKSISKGAFDYWNQTKQIIERTGNLFEAPAGRIESNIANREDEDDDVFGYFAAYAQDTLRLYVSPDQFGSEGRACPPNVPPPPGGGCPVPVCCDCASVAGSQVIRPEFWIE